MALGSGEMASRESGFGGGGAPGSFRAAQDIGFDPQTGAFNAFTNSDPLSQEGIIQRALNNGTSLEEAAFEAVEPNPIERLLGNVLFDRIVGPQLGMERNFAFQDGEPGFQFGIDPSKQLGRVFGMGEGPVGLAAALANAGTSTFDPTMDVGFSSLHEISDARQARIDERKAGPQAGGALDDDEREEEPDDDPSGRREERSKGDSIGEDTTPLFAALYLLRKGLL